jgi:hypothetical protein
VRQALLFLLLAAVFNGCGGGSIAPAPESVSDGGGTGLPAADGSVPSDARAANGGAVTPVAPQYGSMKGASLGPNASLNGAVPFPSDNPWNADVSRAPVDPRSAAILSSIGLTRGLRPDFGSGTWNGAAIGIPYVVVSGAQPKVQVQFVDYPGESDPGPYPIPADAPVEGEPVGQSGVGGGDRHVIVVERDGNRLYETFSSFRNPDGSWRASSGAIFHLDSNRVRPTARPGWTSADAAGLPVFPGLVRYDEASSGLIPHALRFTVPSTRRAYVPPATHWASSSTDPNLPPMGMRVRLRAGFIVPDSFSRESKAILQALKTYGMLLADNGSALFLSGAPDPRWNDARLRAELGQVKASDLEVIRMDGLVTP